MSRHRDWHRLPLYRRHHRHRRRHRCRRRNSHRHRFRGHRRHYLRKDQNDAQIRYDFTYPGGINALGLPAI